MTLYIVESEHISVHICGVHKNAPFLYIHIFISFNIARNMLYLLYSYMEQLHKIHYKNNKKKPVRSMKLFLKVII